MRRKTNLLKIIISLIVTFILSSLLILSSISIATEASSNNKKQLYIYTDDEVLENQEFVVSIYSFNESDIVYFLINSTIEFNSNRYYLDKETAEVSIKAPSVEEDTVFIINASSEGYLDASKNITVLNKLDKLFIYVEKYTIKAGEKFSVEVKDENNNIIKGATVYIQSVVDETSITNENGRAWLTAPSHKQEITIIVTKDNYLDGKTKIVVDLPPSFFDSIRENPYTIVILSIIFLIIVIIYVTYRQKKIDNINKKINEKNDKKSKKPVKHGTILNTDFKNQESNKNIKKGPKIEEIRISRPKKEKEIVPIKKDTDKVNKVLTRRNKNKYKYEWFEGTDNIRYEIDKITGEVDEEGIDKWFEGIDDIRAKIDEKVKNKDKKKKEEEN